MRYSRLLKFCYFLWLTWLFGCKEQGNSTQIPDSTSTSSDLQEIQKEEIKPMILFFGNSLTAGLGVEPEEAFPGVIEKRLDSLAYSYRVVNAGLSGETTASGVNRLPWVLREKPEIFILELGANDGLRGIPLEETKKNLEQIIIKVRTINPEVIIILTGMQIPPNMGPEYATGFRQLFPDLASAQNVLLVPFLLEGVGGVPELNQADGIHPTAPGHRILAENVWNVLAPALPQAGV